MNKGNILHSPHNLGKFIARRRWYQLDSQGRIPMKQLSINAGMLHCTDTTMEVQTDP